MRIVHVSDTHNKEPEVPDGDILIHSGDLTIQGYRVQIYRQFGWLHLLRDRFKYILVTPGNHDLYLEKHFEEGRIEAAEAGLILLHNEEIIIDGVKFYGSGNTPDYHGWAFMENQIELYDTWEKIPADTNVLFTHCPPFGILDESYRGGIGCKDLLRRTKELTQLKLHAFGHAHGGRGMTKVGDLTYSNAATIVNVIDI